MATKRKVSITTIAEEAGVSPATVSRILTGNARVNPEKRRKVEAVIRKYDYRPNYANGVLASTSKKTLGIILPDITHPYYSEVFVGAETMALEKGYGILLGNTLNDRSASGHEMETMLFSLMMERQVSGFLLLGGSLDDHRISEEKIDLFREIGKRTPLLTPGIAKPAWGGPALTTDSLGTIRKAIHYLASLKHRQFGFLGGEPNVNPTAARRQVLLDFIEEFGLTFREEWFVYSGFSMDDGMAAMEGLLQNREFPTAILCVNDLVAFGAMHSAQKHGLRIPEDISVIGCDNIPLSRYLSPALTTIDLKPREEGRIAARMLIDLIEKEERIEDCRIEAEMIIRDSCRRAPE